MKSNFTVWNEVDPGGQIAVTDNPAHSYAFSTSDVNTTAETINSEEVWIVDGTKVRFSTTGSLPGGIGTGIDYYIVGTTATTFQVSASSGGSPINLTTAGSGTHTVYTVETANRITVTAMPRNVDAHVSQDWGAGFFDQSDFTHTFMATNTYGTPSGGLGVFWGLTDTLDDLLAIQGSATADGVFLLFYNGASGTEVYLREVNGTTVSNDLCDTLTSGTTYYYRVSYDADAGTYGTLTASIYSNEAMTTLVDTLILVLTKVPDFRYAIGAMSFNTASTQSITFWVQDVELNIAGHVGDGPYAASLPTPAQSAIWFDGQYVMAMTYQGDGSELLPPRVSYADIDDLVFTDYGETPYLRTLNRGYNFTSFYQFRQSYGVHNAIALNSTSDRAVSFFKENYSAVNDTEFEGDVNALGLSAFPSIAVDSEDKVWIAGHNGTSQVIQRASAAYSLSSWETAETLHSAVGVTQIVVYESGDVGALYSDTNTLYYKHWNSATGWGSAETVTTDLDIYINYRGVVTRNDKLFVVFRSNTTAANLQYRIRNGTWGTESTFASDLGGAADTSYFNACADVGKDESVYVVYFDGTDLVHRIWNGSTVSGKTTLVSSPSFNGTYISVPYYDAHHIPVMYHTGGKAFHVVTIPLTPTQVSGDDFVTDYGATNQSTSTSAQQVSYNSRTLTTWTGRDHRMYGRIYNDTISAWETNAIPLTPRYWDLHNEGFPTLDPDGKVTILYGGRGMGAGADNYIKVKKSNYALGTSEFQTELTENLSAWADISPAEDANSTGRGYKRAYTDQAGAVHLFTATGSQIVIVREYRSGSWSTPVTLFDLGGDNSSYTGKVNYWVDVSIGKEPSGQKSFHMFWTFKDAAIQPEIAGGNLAQLELHYMKIVPQGDGTYKRYNAAGTELTGTTSDTANTDLVYDGTTAPADWVRVGGGVDTLADGTPLCVVHLCARTDPYAVTETRVYRWNGSSWVYTTIQSADFPYHSQPKMTVVSGNIYVTDIKTVSGRNEIVKYISTDDGASFDSGEMITSGSTFDNYNPLISPGDGGSQNLIWHTRIHRNYSEVNAGVFVPPVQLGPGMFLMW